MAIRTRFTELFQVAHPLVLAPMGGVSGGALAAAVSEAGGLGRALRNAFVDSWDGREAEPTANLVTGSWRRPRACYAELRANWVTR
jgi:nitronate monooxygenase